MITKIISFVSHWSAACQRNSTLARISNSRIARLWSRFYEQSTFHKIELHDRSTILIQKASQLLKTKSEETSSKVLRKQASIIMNCCTSWWQCDAQLETETNLNKHTQPNMNVSGIDWTNHERQQATESPLAKRQLGKTLALHTHHAVLWLSSN